MSRLEEALESLGWTLPHPLDPPAGHVINHLPLQIIDRYAHVSGQGPMDGDRVLMAGTIGLDLTVQDGTEAARLTALSMISLLKQQLGDLDRVARWVQVTGFVNCVPGFEETPTVLNGFSDVIVGVWGDAGRHARSAPGVSALPLNVPVIVQATVELEG